jgi:hypothetical protein
MNDKETSPMIDLMSEKMQSKDKEIAEMRTMLRKHNKLLQWVMNEYPSSFLPLAISCKCGELESKYCLCDVSA